MEKEKKIFFRTHPLRKFASFLLLCAVKAAWKPRLSPRLKNQFLELIGFQRKFGFRFSPRALADSQKSYKISQISRLFQHSIKTQLLICSKKVLKRRSFWSQQRNTKRDSEKMSYYNQQQAPVGVPPPQGLYQAACCLFLWDLLILILVSSILFFSDQFFVLVFS